MTPADFRAWMAHRKLTVRSAAEALGRSPATIQDYAAGTSRNTGKPVRINKTVALACAAVAAGLQPWPAPAVAKNMSKSA